jgi:carbohydrate-binding DOMON domain-containing protein
MKKLFTIACTLVLGGALGFAQAGSTTNGQTPAGGDQTKTGTSTTTKKHHKHGVKKTKKSKKSTEGTPAPAASPSPK